ncbi:EF-hand calcium-binding domain-containing protein 11-like [Ischnura elegans]|uniref:EF-hand calcium-binding domain-containing protein 11-like n=1 Tax=Ischnura elegans TaxID=197161 RepID=UPI001ED8BD83|nr:EF-hand calcium-binding domain-containing protein 11-like [Ischnura elegans]
MCPNFSAKESLIMVTIDARNFKHIKEAFRFADVSNKGYLTSNGYKKAIIALFGEKPSKGEKEAIFGCDRNRKLTLKDFTDIILSREKENNREQQIHKAFFLFDLESKGFLVLEDFVKAQLNVFPHLSHRVLEKAFSAADVNNDGRISYREFHSVMSYGFPFFI